MAVTWVDDAVTLPPVDVTDAEISGPAAAVEAHRGQPFDGQAREALTKTLSVLDPQSQNTTELTQRVWIDGTPTEEDPRTRHVIEQTRHPNRVLIVHYRDGQQTRAPVT